jgi:hypothetical protein
MDWQKFLTQLVETKNKFITDMNAALKPLPPIEQHEASTTVGYALREINSAFQWITTTCMRLDSDVKDYIERGQQILADMNKAHVDDLVNKGELIPKSAIEAGDYLSKEVAASTAQAAAEAAANDREKAVRQEIQLLASRRVELCTAKTSMDGVAPGGEPKVIEPALLSREIVDKLPDDLIKGEDYLDKAKLIANRLKDVNALGVNVPQLLARAHELPLDDSGETLFREQLSMIKAAVDEAGGTAKPGGSTGTAPAPLALNGGSRGSASKDLDDTVF